MTTIYENGVKCRQTYVGLYVSFPRFLDLDEEDRRVICRLILGIAAAACKKEGIGRNPIVATARFLQAIEDGQAEIVYGYDGFAEIRRLPNLVVH